MDIYDLLGKIDHTEDQDKVSYSAGVVLAMSLKDMGFEDLKYDDFTEGMKTVFNNEMGKISPKKSIDIFNNYVLLLRGEMLQKNADEGQAFLEKNKENPKNILKSSTSKKNTESTFFLFFTPWITSWIVR